MHPGGAYVGAGWVAMRMVYLGLVFVAGCAYLALGVLFLRRRRSRADRIGGVGCSITGIALLVTGVVLIVG